MWHSGSQVENEHHSVYKHLVNFRLLLCVCSEGGAKYCHIHVRTCSYIRAYHYMYVASLNPILTTVREVCDTCS